MTVVSQLYVVLIMSDLLEKITSVKFSVVAELVELFHV